MQAILTRLMCSSQSRATKTWNAMLFVLTLCLSAAVANAVGPTAPPVVVSQFTDLGALPNGGAIAGGNTAGTNFAVNANGDVIVDTTYGNSLYLYNGQTGATTLLGSPGSAGSVAVDAQNNVYISFQYNSSIAKIPYVSGKYAAVGANAPSTPCTGSDTQECLMANATSGGGGGVVAMIFDAKGDLFYATTATAISSPTDPNSIWECTAACLSSGSPAAVRIYQEPTNSTNPTTAGQLQVGGLGVDPWGNLFFADSAVIASSGANVVANLNELPTSTGAGYGGATTGYAAAPTVLYTLTDASPAQYDNDLPAVAVDANGTVYFGILYNGIYGIPNDGTPISVSGSVPNETPVGMYGVSFQGAKILAVDEKGNVYDVTNNNIAAGDSVLRLSLNSVMAPASPVSTMATVSTATAPNGVYVSLNDGSSCGVPPTITVTAAENGATSTEFAGTAGTCKSMNTGVSFPIAFNFTPTMVGERSAVVSVGDGTSTGTATASGIGQGALATFDPGSKTSYTSGFNYPSWVSVDSNGDLAVPDGGSGSVFVLPSGSSTWASVGTGFTNPQSTAFDANGNLYVADASTNVIFKIANTSTTGGFTAGATTTLVPATMTFGGTVLNEPQGLAVGPSGVLYISDVGNNRVVSYNLNSGVAGVRVTGLSSPVGVAVDGSGNLYVANESAGTVVEYAGGGVTTTLSSIPGVSNPWAIAVDPSGSVLIADSTSGNIVRVPNESGVLTVADAITIENTPSNAYGIAIDASGNIYTTDTTAKAVYAINRSMPSADFGLVTNPAVGTATVYAEVSGNMPITLGTPFIGTPTNSDFAITSTTGSHKCQDGGVGPVGQWCMMAATFTPTVSDNGTISGTSTLTTTVPAASYTLSMTATSAGVVPPTPQVITGFPATGSAVVGQQVMLSATGGSTIPVVFTIDGASTGTGSISGNMLTVTGAGTLVIDANEAGGTVSGIVYTAAPQEQDTITVTTATEPGGSSSNTGFIVSQATQIGALTGGGWNPSQSPLSGTFVVGANGDVIISDGYGSGVLDITQSGTQTTLASLGNSTATAMDSSGNVYVASYADYSGAATIYKIPYNSSTMKYVGFTTAPTTDCVGGDTTACVYAPNLTASIFASGHSGYSAMTFDASGNLFVETSAYATGKPNAIYECGATCQTSATGTPTLLYTDSMSLGAIAVDPWGNLFFGDGSNAAGSGVSYLEELVYTSGVGYAASPTTLESYTNKAGYGNGFSGVATDANGTIYFATDGDGIFAIPNTSGGGPDLANAYAVSTVGGKGITVDSAGNLYQIPYNGGDVVDRIQINNVTDPSATVDGAATSASVTVTDNYYGCSDSPVLAIVSSNADFSATAGTGCSASLGTGNGTFSPALSSVIGSNFPATVKFAPTASGGGAETATLSISDTTNGGEGTAMASGVGELTGQTITFTALSSPVTYSSGMTIPLSATGGASGNPVVFTIDGSSTGTGTISGTTLTVTGAGTIVIDANQAGGSGYGAATQAQQSVVVNQASQTITITSPTASQQINEPTNDMISLVATGGASGNAVTFTIDGSSTGTGTISGSTLTVTGLGTFVIDANQAGNTNYMAAAQASVTFTVVPSNPQTISFTQPSSPVTYAYGMTIPLVATGGGSGNPVVFTIDGSSTGTGIISGSTLTVTGAGTIVIDANQAASAGYAQAAQVQVSVVVNRAAQVIAFTQPTSPVTYAAGLTVSLSATGGMSGNAVTFTIDASSTATGTISGNTLTVTGAGTCSMSNPGCAGNIVIDANQAGTTNYTPAVQVQMTVVVYATTPTFTFTAPPSTLTVETGSSASTTITISPEYGFSGTITFACSNLPVGDTCTFTPPSLTFTSASNASQSTTLKIASSTPLAANHPSSLPLFPAATMAAALCFLGFKKRNRLQLLVLLAVSLAGLGLMSGCGGKFHTTPPTVNHATITITATSGSTQQSTTLILWQQ